MRHIATELTLGDYIGPKKSSENHRYRTNNRLRKNRFIYVNQIDYIINSLSKYLIENEHFFI